ncbi:hypothetical protein GOP47_0025569 [Adiantum capillus-veneris]|uniref:Ubiquitin-like protease family profile domain-containing protein n=1 Tax=Adiantum capillus-veneris TaxID=13818 RepID=A0A9D4U1M8_ADICA|nr:hypothetical protein GOP47_0025569 [Adiantum capillus-veneris]
MPRLKGVQRQEVVHDSNVDLRRLKGVQRQEVVRGANMDLRRLKRVGRRKMVCDALVESKSEVREDDDGKGSNNSKVFNDKTVYVKLSKLFFVKIIGCNSKYYVEVIRERDGALRHYCRVDGSCPQWNKSWEKCSDLMHHLKERHRIVIDIPHRKRGRPKNSQKHPLTSGSRSHRQLPTRFASIETRIKLARRKHLKDLHKGYQRRWLFISLNGKMDFEEWLQKYVDDEIKEWESRMPKRIKEMEAKTAKGYAAWARSHKGHKYADQQEVKEEDMEEGVHDRMDREITPPFYQYEAPISIKAPTKVRNVTKLERSIDEIPKFKILNVSSPPRHINISSPFESTDRNQASSCTLTLFVMCLENTLIEENLHRAWFVDSLWLSFMRILPSQTAIRNYFSRVDLSSFMWTFFSVIDEDHWTLAVFFNHRICHVTSLPTDIPTDKSEIIFFDSLSMSSIDRYMSSTKRVLQHFSTYTMDPDLKEDLLHPEKCHVQTMESNTKDCGYYVLLVMKLLITGGARHNNPKKWLTSKWFTHAEVEALKMDLADWAKGPALQLPK